MVSEVRIVATLGLGGWACEWAFWDAGKALFLELAAGNTGVFTLSKVTELTLKCFSVHMFRAKILSGD